MKILNLYAGIGGNRKLWTDVDVTAVEMNPKIAAIYRDFFPKDKMIIGDAHKYLLEHFKEFDFIWSSPPCPTHSRMRMLWKGNGNEISNKVSGASYKFPDMKLYEEIIFLRYFFEGKYCVENVISYYKPLIRPTESGSHYFWTNFHFSPINNIARNIRNQDITDIGKNMGFDLSSYELPYRFRRDMINNLIIPELGLHILNESQRIVQPELFNKL